MKKFSLITIIFASISLQTSFCQGLSDSTIALMKDGTIYKLDISQKKDLKTYKTIFKNEEKIKWCKKSIKEYGTIYSVSETMPEFPNGLDAFRDYVSRHLIYPNEAQKKGIEGIIYVQFLITETGEVKFLNVIKGENVLLKNEAKRVIEASPKWKPGLVNNTPVKVEFIYPISFILR